MWRNHRKAYSFMLAPYLIGLLLLVGLPGLYSLAIAFTDYHALSSPRWSGLTNFARLVQDGIFLGALWRTLLYLLLSVTLRIGGALMLALLFERVRRLYALVLCYLPTAIPDIAYALIWLAALNPRYGPVNRLLELVSLPTPAWIVEPAPAFAALVLISVWQMGEGFIVLLASLREIPAELHHAAAIDGAGSLQRFRHITLPLLLDRLILLSARDLIVALQANFVPSLVITRGGPGYATLFVPLYAYQLAFDDLDFGYAATVVWSLYAITLVIVFVQQWLRRRSVAYGL